MSYAYCIGHIFPYVVPILVARSLLIQVKNLFCQVPNIDPIPLLRRRISQKKNSFGSVFIVIIL